MDHNEIKVFIETYEEYLAESFRALWALVDIEYDKLDAYSVIGALLSRQVTLSIEMARSPNTWTAHSAPLFLRAMTDLHITLSWIMLDLVERSTKYILHGLGDEKLVMEHYKKCIEDNPGDEMNEYLEKVVQIKSDWINSQKRDFLVEVNLGHWAQLDYRRMSQEADCEDLYKFAYKPFSQAAHSMWPHVSCLNSKYCESPLHKYHLVPELFSAPLDLDFLYRSCKYVDKAYKCFVEKFSLNFTHKMPLEWWYSYFNNIQNET